MSKIYNMDTQSDYMFLSQIDSATKSTQIANNIIGDLTTTQGLAELLFSQNSNVAVTSKDQ